MSLYNGHSLFFFLFIKKREKKKPVPSPQEVVIRLTPGAFRPESDPGPRCGGEGGVNKTSAPHAGEPGSLHSDQQLRGCMRDGLNQVC